MAGTGQTQNLEEGKGKALQALFDSLSLREDPQASDTSRITDAHAEVISDKINSLLGGGGPSGTPLSLGQGKPVNEEGLPIIEISEPITDRTSNTASNIPPLPAVPVVPADNRDSRRRERDRILDLLEAEEEEENARESAAAQVAEQQQHANAQRDLERLKAQREMQKKMGKALIKNLTIAREKEAEAKEAETRAWQAEETDRLRIQAADATANRRPRKTVSWAELPKGHSGASKDKMQSPSTTKPPAQAGDVALGTINTVPATMKHDVVERARPVQLKDSDDESDPEESNSDEENLPLPSTADSEDTLSGDESEDDPSYKPDFHVLDDDIDIDTVQHQREIALQYYEKQGTIGAEIMRTMSSQEPEGGSGDWDQPEVPLEATLAHSPPKPSESRFKRSRAQPTVAEGATSQTGRKPSLIRQAIRTGKIEHGKLVGGPDLSEDEDDKQSDDILGMLQRGELTNMGPNPPTTPSSSRPPASMLSPNGLFSSSEIRTSDISGSTSSSGLTTLHKSSVIPERPSGTRFNTTLTSSVLEASSSPLATPTNSMDRSSPKLPSSSPIMNNVLERTPRGNPILVPTSNTIRSNASRAPAPAKPPIPAIMPSMIVDSPSFPPLGQEPAEAQDAAPRKASRFMSSRR